MKKLYITTVLIAVCSLFVFNPKIRAQSETGIKIQEEEVIGLQDRQHESQVESAILNLDGTSLEDPEEKDVPNQNKVAEKKLQSPLQESQMKWFDRRKFLFMNQFVWSFSMSSAGVGVEATTALSDKIFLRVGVDVFPKTVGISDKIRVDDDVLRARVGYYPDYHVKFKPQLFHGHILFNYHPRSFFNNFHLTAGVYLGLGDIKATGRLKNPETGENSVLLDPTWEWPNLVVENRSLNIDDGVLNATIRMGEIVKPYVGIGYSRTIPKYKNDWGFNWDLGVMIQPTNDIRQGGNRSKKQYESPAIDISKHLNRVRVWPVMSFRVSYRVK